ncbi:MAG: GNAT family N-acetyltransferase [Clostridia bacterium]|nr:GNAT family N-acetyltransferase [Clostridia bacterium]
MYKLVNVKIIDDNFLDTFERFQETKRIYDVDIHGTLREKDEYYVDDWDILKKEQVVHILRYYLDTGGAVVALVEGSNLLGFAAINGKPMGMKGQYLNLGFIHVSNPYRGHGLGKVLFTEICKEARLRNAKKLYIGANPAVDTYRFYKAMGCTLAQEIVEEIYNHEPLDLQLEYDL